MWRNKQKQKDAQRRWPLRASMVMFILLCWLLPILAVVGVSGYLTGRNTREHVAEIVMTSIENAMDTVLRDLENVVEDSINSSYVPAIRNAYSQYRRDGNSKALYNTIDTFLHSFYGRNRRLLAAYLVFEQGGGNRYYTTVSRNSLQADPNVFYSGVNDEAYSLVDTLGTDIAFLQKDGRLYMVRVLSLLDNRFNSYGVLVLELNQELLYETLTGLPWITGASISLGGAAIPIQGDDTQASLQSMQRQGVRVQSQQQQSLTLYDEIVSDRFTMQYYVQADLRPMLQGANASVILIVLLSLLSVPLLILMLRFLDNRVNRPLKEMGGLTTRIKEGHFGEQMPAEALSSEEMYSLANNLNAMSAHLEYQFERIYREELALRDAEIKALQSQINPHFLGNTLEIINWEARMAGDIKTSNMLEALSTMLEAALDRRRRPLVHLSEELMYVNSYLYIIKERFGKRLEVRQQIPPELLDWYVPRLILQPIIENAVEHGLAGTGQGILTIRAVAEQDGWMRLEVENNRPMTEEDHRRVAMLLSDEGGAATGSLNIGIRNVHLRLRLLYGEGGGLLLTSTKSNSTVCALRIHNQQEQQISTT